MGRDGKENVMSNKIKLKRKNGIRKQSYVCVGAGRDVHPLSDNMEINVMVYEGSIDKDLYLCLGQVNGKVDMGRCRKDIGVVVQEKHIRPFG